jgi:hypothetical protein
LVTCGYAGERPGDWSGNYPPCDRHEELLKRQHMTLGIRFSTSNHALAAAFAHALDFWATVVDMEWYEENSQHCAAQVLDGERRLFKPTEAARAQFPDMPAFQGWIAFNRQADLSAEEQFQIAVHELGHVLGLPHNPHSTSVMFFLRVDGPIVLDESDMKALAARHKLRTARSDLPLTVSAARFP